jgi:hypothetical protein
MAFSSLRTLSRLDNCHVAALVKPGKHYTGNELEEHRVDCLFCLGLFGLLGLTYDQIGRRMGITSRTAQRWVAEARTYPSRARRIEAIEVIEDMSQ